ncbi:hypothetical protein [Streptomyces sp. enrichment culture]|uniref:hypothetical protein n=1 Tax=Streptomyces sp. enrichment culture TaxID=1795815 RepID=UPI003F56C3AF
MSGSTTTRTEPGAGQHDAPAPLPTAAGEPHHPPSGRTATPRSGPVADCTADSAGGLTFDVTVPAEDAHGEDAGLLLRRRPSPSGETEEVRLPLSPVQGAAPGTLRAALPSTVPLSEGRWNVFLVLPGAQPRRLAPGVNDLRSLVDRVPQESRTWLGVRIPYATKNGNLSVRSWMRWPHAEADSLHVHDGGLRLTGRLYGAELARTAVLEARPRRGEHKPVQTPVTGQGADQREFTATLPYGPLAGHRLWDLWLRPAADAEGVRVARILDDVPDKKRIFTYPEHPVAPPEAATEEETGLVAKPYYTLNNDLAVRVDRVTP